jgi:hypothetical protein
MRTAVFLIATRTSTILGETLLGTRVQVGLEF